MVVPDNKTALFYMVFLYFFALISFISPLIAAVLSAIAIILFKKKKKILASIILIIALLILVYAIEFYLNVSF